MKRVLEIYKQKLRYKNYSQRTIDTYLCYIAGHNSIKTTMIYTHVSNKVIQNSYTPI